MADKCLKLGRYYVIGTKTKFLIENIFNLGLRSENIEKTNYENSKSAFWSILAYKQLLRFDIFSSVA